MASIRTTFRAIVVAGVIASLGAGSFCPCSADLVAHRVSHQIPPGSHYCACVLKSGHCHCGKACQCGQPMPQKNKVPFIPTSSNDRGQPLGLPTDVAMIDHSAVAALHSHNGPNTLTASNLTLIAQGTRLNV
jgi:hypothetical protein